MPSDIEQLDAPNPEAKADQFEENNQTAESIRYGIAGFLKDNEFRRTLDKEALEEYEALAEGGGHDGAQDAGNLQKFYSYMKGQFEMVKKGEKQIDELIKEAIQTKVINEKHRGFYDKSMRKDVLNGTQVVTEEVMNKAEWNLKESLKKRREERTEYDALVNNPLVLDGKMTIAKGKTIKIPDEKEFLAMKIPDRKKWLKEVKEAIPKAKRVAEKLGDQESIKLTGEYKKLLEAAMKEGMIGKATFNEYMKGFEKVDHKDKKYWLSEMKNGNQLARYRELWKNAKKDLSDVGYARLRTSIDKKGYTKLSEALETEKKKEGKLMDEAYKGKLKALLDKDVISQHTYKAFNEDMARQELRGKRKYQESFEAQMERYKNLRKEIDELGGKDPVAKKTLDDMYQSGEYGFSEINARFRRLSGGAKEGQRSPEEVLMDRELNAIENRSVRKAVKKGFKKADKSDMQKLAEKFTTFFTNKLSKTEDPLTYQKKLGSERKKHRIANIHHMQKDDGETEISDTTGKKKTSKIARIIAPARQPEAEEHKGGENASKSFDQEEVELSNEEYRKKLAHRAKTQHNHNKTFERKTFYSEKGDERRVMRAQINSADGVKSLNQVENLNRDTDHLSVNVWADNRVNELKLNDIRATVRYLRLKISSTEEETEDRVAA